MEKITIALLSLLLIGCFADVAQCQRMDDVGGEEMKFNYPSGTCYKSVPISNECLVKHRCWCCWNTFSCYHTKDECQLSCPKK
ncbi:hypothetical protein PVAP13_1KG132500 [Panicum virgatum]|uniref:Meg domain-containing protein n=1 Tax=Panicum virgatum TaxID=38727 RepID=A0A8T0X5M7_PANVG|nr:hypothetical protein PVAP13_1KG132500 [Panicum virgatum]